MRLPQKQRRFVDAWLALPPNPNGVQIGQRGIKAAAAAGYAAPEKYAYVLMRTPAVVAEIERIEREVDQRRAEETASVSAAQQIDRRLDEALAGDIRDIAEVRDGEVVVRDSSEWPDAAARLIDSIETTRGGGVRINRARWVDIQRAAEARAERRDEQAAVSRLEARLDALGPEQLAAFSAELTARRRRLLEEGPQ